MTDDTQFEDVPMEQWLTAKQIARQLEDTSYTRTVEVLREIREAYSDYFRQVGRAFLYHPHFVDLVDSREKTPGVKSKKSNDNQTA